MTQPQGKLDVAWSLMQEVKVPMVVTHDGDNGRMRAGPMAAHLDPDANAIFLLTDAQAAKDKEIDLNDIVCLVFSDIRKQHYVSLTGRAELSDDRAKIKQLWSSLDSAFWSDANDPSIRALKITPTIAEILGPRRRHCEHRRNCQSGAHGNPTRFAVERKSGAVLSANRRQPHASGARATGYAFDR